MWKQAHSFISLPRRRSLSNLPSSPVVRRVDVRLLHQFFRDSLCACANLSTKHWRVHSFVSQLANHVVHFENYQDPFWRNWKENRNNPWLATSMSPVILNYVAYCRQSNRDILLWSIILNGAGFDIIRGVIILLAFKFWENKSGAGFREQIGGLNGLNKSW